MKVSACLITKNEAENILRCLESLREIADEVIVVDTGSKDNTKELALNHGAKVYHFQWDNNFSNARNFALDQINSDWVIFLDADEYFEVKTQNILIKALKRIDKNKEFDAVLCKMINTDGFNGKTISENPTLRIFRGNCGIRYKGAVHEQPYKGNKPLRIISLTEFPLIIYHTGYSSALLLEKTKRNLKILENEIEKNIITNQTYYYMSSMHSNLNNYDEAIKYAHLSLEEPTFKDTIFAYKPYAIIIDAMLHLKGKYTFKDIEKYIYEAVSYYPTHPEIWHAIGNVQKEKNDYPSAIESYLKAIEYNKNYTSIMNNNFPARLGDVYFNLANLSQKIGDKVNALEYYYESLKIDKFNIDSLSGLYELIKEQDPAEILLFLSSIYDKDNKDDLVFLYNAMHTLGNTILAAYYYNLHDKL